MKSTTPEPGHTLRFMGVGPVETFRCRIYSAEPREPLTKDEARAWILEETAKHADGIFVPNYDEWHLLVGELADEGLVHAYCGMVFAGPDYKRPGE